MTPFLLLFLLLLLLYPLSLLPNAPLVGNVVLKGLVPHSDPINGTVWKLHLVKAARRIILLHLTHFPNPVVHDREGAANDTFSA